MVGMAKRSQWADYVFWIRIYLQIRLNPSNTPYYLTTIISPRYF